MPRVLMSTRNCVRPWRRFSLVGGEVEGDHVIGDMRIACPDLAPVNTPALSTFVALVLTANRAKAGAWFAFMPMTKHNWPRQMPDKCFALMCSGAYLTNRAALTVRYEMRPNRRIGDAKFLCHDVTPPGSCARARHIFWARSYRSSP